MFSTVINIYIYQVVENYKRILLMIRQRKEIEF